MQRSCSEWALQDGHCAQLIQKESGLSLSNTAYCQGALPQLISSDSQLTHLQNTGNNSTSSTGLEGTSPRKTLNGFDIFHELQIDGFFL